MLRCFGIGCVCHVTCGYTWDVQRPCLALCIILSLVAGVHASLARHVLSCCGWCCRVSDRRLLCPCVASALPLRRVDRLALTFMVCTKGLLHECMLLNIETHS